MTAEIAILNKYAVALAADSAVTISADDKEQKIFDSGDKLFELSRINPIGIMIYNGMDFVDVPLPVLIKKFRSKCSTFQTVKDAAFKFLEYLNSFGINAPDTTKESQIRKIVEPIVDRISKKYRVRVEEEIINDPKTSIKTADDFRKISTQIMTECIELYERLLATRVDASFVGKGRIKDDKVANDVIISIVGKYMRRFNENLKNRVVTIGKLCLIKDMPSGVFTGLVIAGFGSDELFPTLISFEIDGMVSGRLKYLERNFIDIDRSATRSLVVPFAQKEMVERFLYGLDEKIQRDVAGFCKEAVTDITKRVLDQIDFEDLSAKQSLKDDAKKGEDAFVRGLQERAFSAIRTQSQAEIEDMVDFMPKPELARMAEALVNLTSIKRRVSRGVETVGGPIDVAVISHAEDSCGLRESIIFPQN